MAEGLEPIRSDEDVEEILRLAVRNTGMSGDSLRDRLKASASELGISDAALEQAERTWAESKQSAVSKEQDLEDRKVFRKIQLGDFITHFGVYAIINAFLFWIDGRDHTISWAFWPLVCWGIAVAIHFLTTLVYNEEKEKEFQKWQKKRRKK